MFNLINIGSFDLKGNQHGFHGCSLYFDVYRKGDMLMIEFVNNAILPIQVKRDEGGANMLFVRSHPLFDSALMDYEVITMQLFSGINAIDVDAVLLVGDPDNPRLKALVQTKTFGYISFAPNSKTSYSFEELSAWCKARGVAIPVGFCSALAQFTGTFGYELQRQNELYIVKFPNGFKFPIIRTPYGMKFVDHDVCFGSALRCLCVKVRSIDKDSVVFRVVIIAGEDGHHLMCCDNIKYGREFIEYGGRTIKTALITKQLLMSGS